MGSTIYCQCIIHNQHIVHYIPTRSPEVVANIRNKGASNTPIATAEVKKDDANAEESKQPSRKLTIQARAAYADLKKHDRTDYEPESLRTMLAALDRSFRSSGCKYSIVKDKEFAESREVLNGKAIELREQGKGKRKNKADAVTDEEEELMWKKGILGDKSPTSLNYTVFYTLSQQFGTQGHQEHHQIMIEDLKFVKNAITGQTEYVKWVEGLTKTCQGGLTKRDRRVPQ